MRYNRKLNFVFIIITVAVIATFAYNYNTHVRKIYNEASVNNREILRQENNEIVARLLQADSIEDWQTIVEEYEHLAIEIENSENLIVTESIGAEYKEPAIRVRTAYEFRDEQVYMIKTSGFVFKDYADGLSVSVKSFVVIEFLFGIAFIILFVFFLYNFTLKNYKLLYEAIEEYEKTGKLRKTKLKGYAGHIYKRFSSMTESLDRQRKNQQNMIASISHDIKTPLTSIMGYSERLRKDNISEERRKRYLETVYGKSLEIQGLVDEFDEYISFKLVQEKDTVVIDAEFMEKRIIEEFATDMELVGVDMEIVNHAGKATVCVNRKKMKRVFSNVFANCEKHFIGKDKKIKVEIYCDDLKAYIDISDNGKGISDGDYDIIFEPLYTSDGGRKMAGLGLAICREIINSHGGRIYAKKSDMGGLAICIELDRCDVTQYL